MAKRAYRNAAQWQQLIDLWHTSELSITEFCQTHQLSTTVFFKIVVTLCLNIKLHLLRLLLVPYLG